MIFNPEMLSLFEFLHSKEYESQRNQLTKKDKIKLCSQIANVFNILHSFNPPVCHGHLNSHNLFVDLSSFPRIKILLGDLELMPLLKYSNTFE